MIIQSINQAWPMERVFSTCASMHVSETSETGIFTKRKIPICSIVAHLKTLKHHTINTIHFIQINTIQIRMEYAMMCGLQSTQTLQLSEGKKITANITQMRTMFTTPSPVSHLQMTNLLIYNNLIIVACYQYHSILIVVVGIVTNDLQ